jgi:hypothetical protein
MHSQLERGFDSYLSCSNYRLKMRSIGTSWRQYTHKDTILHHDVYYLLSRGHPPSLFDNRLMRVGPSYTNIPFVLAIIPSRHP